MKAVPSTVKPGQNRGRGRLSGCTNLFSGFLGFKGFELIKARGRAQVTVARLGKMVRAKVLEGDPATDRYKLSIWTEVDVANRCAHVPFFWVFRFHL